MATLDSVRLLIAFPERLLKRKFVYFYIKFTLTSSIFAHKWHISRAYDKWELLLQQAKVSRVPLQLNLHDLRPIPRTNRHEYTERELTKAVALFEQNGNLRQCQTETKVPRRAISK